jgi:hypothetical protein
MPNCTNKELANIVDTSTVFGKISPLHKARLIRILKRKGHILVQFGRNKQTIMVREEIASLKAVLGK